MTEFHIGRNFVGFKSYKVIESSHKSHRDRGEFDHLIAYSLACTFENEVVSERNYERICFGSLNEVMIDDELLKRLVHGMDCNVKQAAASQKAQEEAA